MKNFCFLRGLCVLKNSTFKEGVPLSLLLMSWQDSKEMTAISQPLKLNSLSCLPEENRWTWLFLYSGREDRKGEADELLHFLWFFMGNRSKRPRFYPQSRPFSFKPLTPARVWLLDSSSWPEADLMKQLFSGNNQPKRQTGEWQRQSPQSAPL